MKTRRSMLSQLWSKCFPAGKPSQTSTGKPARLERVDGSSTAAGSQARPPRNGIEMLEGRIAPATLVNPSTVMFIDLDGDEVVVKFSKPLFTQTGAQLNTVLNDVFKFNIPGFSSDPATPQQLQLIDLTKLPLLGDVQDARNPAAGVSITITANKADTLKAGATEGQMVLGQDGVLDGDGLTNIGAIIATDIASTDRSVPLGKVIVDGDLGQIDAGVSTSKIGLVSLQVNSLGAVANTQPANYAGSLESRITGALGSLTVETEMKGYLNVVSASGTKPIAIGTIGNVTIGGTLEGGTLDNSGTIQSATTIGKIKIGRGEIVTPPAGSTENTTPAGITDGIKGGSGKNTGAIVAGGKIASIIIDGDLQGGGGENSGTIRASGDLGAVKIGTGVAGHGILGGTGLNSGSIQGSAKIASVSVSGDMIGGTGAGTGSIVATGAIGKIQIDGKVDTVTEGTGVTAGSNSARIYSRADLGNVTIDGNLEGGSTVGTGTIRSDGKMGVITIGGDLLGGGAGAGGIIATGKLAGVNIAGDLRGGTGLFSGFVQGESDIGFVKIKGDLEGTTATAVDRAGIITASGMIGQVSIDGSIIGGKGESSGSVHAGTSGVGDLAKVMIGKQLLGGEGFGSGAIYSGTKIGSVEIKSANTEVAVQGGLGTLSASITSAGTIGSVVIAGDVIGGEGISSGSVQSHGLLAKLTITGGLAGGKGAQSGSIISMDIWDDDIAGDLGRISIDGLLKAGEGARSGLVSADGDLKSLNLGGIDVGTFETGAAGAGSASVITGLGAVHQGNAGKIAVSGGMDGGGNHHTLLEIHGSLGSLSVREGIANGDIHIAANLGKLSIGTLGKKGVEANLENVVLTAGGIVPTSAKLATAIAGITVSGDVINSQILAGYNLAGIGTNADAQIGTVKVSGNWTASDLVAGINAVNGEFGDIDDAVIAGGDDSITSRIANVIIGGTVSGTADPTTDHFGFVAQQIVKFKTGGADLPADVAVREVATA